MARPTPFDRQTSFTAHSSAYPDKPQSGADLDGEFNAVKVALDETQSNLGRIQDDDGRLARGSVGRAQFDSSVRLGFENPKPWEPDTAYEAELSTVFREAKFYSCLETHVSTDTFDPVKWFEIADLSASAAIDPGSITDEQLADNAVTSAKISALAVTSPKLAAGAVTNSKIGDREVTLSKLADALFAQLADRIIPAGLGPIPWSLNGDAPAGWIYDGGTYLRADYPSLWTAIAAELALPNGSTYYTAGDGSTTFTIKSLAGRAVVGVDYDSDVLDSLTRIGNVVGSKNHTLIREELPAFKPSITIFDPGHQHAYLQAEPVATWQPASSSAFSHNTPALTDPAFTGITAAFTDNLGSGQAHSIVQPVVAARFIFKAH